MVVIVWEFDLHLPSSVICVYHRLKCEFASRSWCGVLDTTLSVNVCQCLTTGWLFSSGTSVSSTKNDDPHDMTELLLKVALDTNKLIASI